MVEAENMMTMTTADEGEITASCSGTRIIVERKTYFVYILEMTRIFRGIAAGIPRIFNQR